ncbi:p53 and DNA damage-regulated protein 1 [Mortierella polycephala]|uniref:P53 and DNA damage-regulated protein 1 n=1 Tax=Mortierella polycephala TaxID=41804 RepID=A0A9P6UBF4_9FUNG|nr:p53 and DNA damage-regulated protein 1 [Mortierella polycephala]
MELVSNLQKRELIAEEILTNKELIVDYDRRRNSNREALSKLKKDLSEEKKVWVNLGDLFIKMPKGNVETMIKKAAGIYSPKHVTVDHILICVASRFDYVDQNTLDTEILEIREVMKEKVVELEKLEGGDGSKSRAFQLKGMASK